MSDWTTMTHDQIYEAVHRGPGGGAAMLAEDAWRGVQDIIVAAESRAHSAIAASVGEWDGGGAESARAALSTLNGWVLGAIDDARSTLHALTEQGFNAASFRATVPPPHAYELFEAQSEAMLNPASREAADRAFRAESTAQDPVVQAMGERAKDRLREYVNQSYANLRNMSYWSVPPVVTVDTSPVTPAGGGGDPGPSVFTPFGPAGGAGLGGGPGAVGGSAAGVPGSGSVSGPAGYPAAFVPVAAPAGGATGGGGAGLPPGIVPSGVPAGLTGGASGAVPVGWAGGAPDAAPNSGRSGTSGSVPGGGIGGTLGGVPVGGIGGAPGSVPVGGNGGVPVALAPGAGGRGVRPVPDLRSGSSSWGGVRPVIPGQPPALAPSPTWRDLVTGGSGRPFGGPGTWGGGGGSGGGPATPLGTPPRGETGPRVTTVGAPAAEPVRGGSTGGMHGLYPPMAGGAGGGQGQERRRAPYLIDDSGVFDVQVPYTEPVIGGEPIGPSREA